MTPTALLLAEFRALREDLGLKQREAAEILGLRPSTISVYETGKGNITDERILELIKQLKESGGNNGRLAHHVPVPDRAVANATPVEVAQPAVAPAPAPDAEAASRPAPQAQTVVARPLYSPAPRRRGPRTRTRTCPLPRGAVDENEACICGSPRKRHDALRFSCQDCRRGASGCQFFRPASRFSGAA
jgi:transcriptional regulator with XRE-family HTH domain